jgi:hypothetical protein
MFRNLVAQDTNLIYFRFRHINTVFPHTITMRPDLLARFAVSATSPMSGNVRFTGPCDCTSSYCVGGACTENHFSGQCTAGSDSVVSGGISVECIVSQTSDTSSMTCYCTPSRSSHGSTANTNSDSAASPRISVRLSRCQFLILYGFILLYVANY